MTTRLSFAWGQAIYNGQLDRITNHFVNLAVAWVYVADKHAIQSDWIQPARGSGTTNTTYIQVYMQVRPNALDSTDTLPFGPMSTGAKAYGY